jgi:hypothetical protein
MADAYTFNWPDEGMPRKAYRISLPGLVVRIKEQKKFYVVKDISACGVAFSPNSGKGSFEIGQKLTIALIYRKRLIVRELLARVVRSQETIVACEFIDLDHRQEYRLDKFVLEVQKILINKQKRQRKD